MMEKYKINGESVEVFSVDSDANGNPRYVIHWMNVPGADTFAEARMAMGATLGGREYRAKWFGGGIVFSSYSVSDELTRAFASIRKTAEKEAVERLIDAAKRAYVVCCDLGCCLTEMPRLITAIEKMEKLIG